MSTKYHCGGLACQKSTMAALCMTLIYLSNSNVGHEMTYAKLQEVDVGKSHLEMVYQYFHETKNDNPM